MGFTQKEIRELKDCLYICKQSAKDGIEVAIQNQEKVKDIINVIDGILKNLSFYVSNMKIPQECKEYRTNLIDLKSDLNILNQKMLDDFTNYKDQLENFTITVFGKTTVGKSTLMEVLTNGNGKSIGKGAQRTTRDIRHYIWKETGIKFTDVPGIGAAERGGNNDTEKAFFEAKYADLILFLITDDAPQEDEAKALAMIKDLGKPVICILNVKSCGIGKKFSSKLRLKKVKEKMRDLERLNGIRNQFLLYASKFGQNWNNIPFYYSDLNTAWLSEQEDYKQDKELFYEFSQFGQITKAIIEQIKTKGSFYQFKTLIDIIYNAVNDTYKKLLMQYMISSQSYDNLNKEYRQLILMKNKYDTMSKNKIENCLVSITAELKKQVFTFSENYYDDKDAGEKWQKIVKSLGIEKKINDLFIELRNDCKNKLSDFRYGVQNGYLRNLDLKTNGIRGDDPWDIRWGMGLGALVIPFLPVGLVAGIIGGVAYGLFTTLITDSKAEKIKKRKIDLKNQLLYWIDGSGNISVEQRKKMSSPWIPQIENQIYLQYQSIFKAFEETEDYYLQLINQMKGIGQGQLLLARQINDNLCRMNQALIYRALIFIGQKIFIQSISNIYRLSGKAILLVVKEEKRLSRNVIRRLKELLQEDIYVCKECKLNNINEKKVELLRLLDVYGYPTIKVESRDNIIYIRNEFKSKLINLQKYNGNILDKNQVKLIETYRKEISEIRNICALIEQMFNMPIREVEE